MYASSLQSSDVSLGSITSRCSEKEPALLPRSSSRGVTQTRHERAAEIEPNVSCNSTDQIAGLIWSTVYRSLEYDNGTRLMPKVRWFNLTRCSSKTRQSKCLYWMFGQCHKILFGQGLNQLYVFSASFVNFFPEHWWERDWDSSFGRFRALICRS